MVIQEVPFCTVDWSTVIPTEHTGINGKAYWRTFEMGNIRVRTRGYVFTLNRLKPNGD